MADTLVTAVNAVIARVLLLEPLACTAATYATKWWIATPQGYPYWVNRPSTMPEPEEFAAGLVRYYLGITMRLVLCPSQAIMHTDNVSGNMQDNAWAYQAGVMRYFKKHDTLAVPPTYAALAAVERTTITCPVGLDLRVVELTQTADLGISFELTVPLLVGQEET